MKALPLAYRQVHLDFHTSEQIAGIGKEFDPEQFVATLQEARVNSITCFSKCHHGMIYHETEFPAKHPHLETNLLAEQIEACHAAGIRVPIYISVGLDMHQSSRHPEWRELGVDGKIRGAAPLDAGWHKLCFNSASPYIDYVLAQTQEVLDNFEVDGLFFDIISQGQCVCQRCLAGMLEQDLDPECEEDRAAYAAEVLAGFKRRMSQDIRERNSECNIFYNAGHVGPGIRSTLDTYTHLELESLPSGGWGYDHFPTTVRYARGLGYDFLGMTGKFQKSWADFGGFKNRAALEYECFTALAEGGKCSIGDQLHPSGALDPATYSLIGSVYAEVEAKEPWCVGALPVTEIGIVTPEALGREDGRVDSAAGGAYRMLLEAHYQFDIVDGEMDWERYRAVILPDKIHLTPDLKEKLEAFIAGGGVAVLSHESGLDPDHERFILDGMPVYYRNAAPYNPDFVVPAEAVSAGILPSQHVMYDRGLEVEAVAGAESLGEVWHPYFNRTYRHFCSHFHTPPEKASGFPAAAQLGRVIYFAHPIFGAYFRHGPRMYRQWFLNCLQRALPDKLVRTNAPTTAHLTLTHQPDPGRAVLHLLHYVPERRYGAVPTIEDVLPLHELEVSIEFPQAPDRVYLAGTEASLPFDYADGRVNVILDRLDGHAMLVLE